MEILKVLEEKMRRLHFLEEEVKRCYKEIENHEATQERLKSDLENYMAAYQRQIWKEMKHMAFARKNRRKFKHR